jgi:uncharacterized peroxidase-related enzyme
MSKVILKKELDCSDDIKEIFDEIREGFNCEEMSDYFLLLAHNKGALKSTWLAYKYILLEGVVPRQIKEMIFLSISLSKGCHYCSSSHLALCDMYKVSEDSIDSIIKNIETLNPERIKRIIKFSLKITNEPKSVTKHDYQSLLDDGLNMEEITEIMSIATFCASGIQIAQAAGLDVEQGTADYLTDNNLSIGF